MKKELYEVMGWDGPTTHRQFVAWLEYKYGPQYTKSTITHYYLMQIAMEIRRIGESFNKKPASIKMSDFELEFKVGKPKAPLTSLTPEQVEEAKKEKAERSKAIWKGILGG